MPYIKPEDREIYEPMIDVLMNELDILKLERRPKLYCKHNSYRFAYCLWHIIQYA